jgi:1-acyl-sn-glycerol-3-phosphate acyltransferase
MSVEEIVTTTPPCSRGTQSHELAERTYPWFSAAQICELAISSTRLLKVTVTQEQNLKEIEVPFICAPNHSRLAIPFINYAVPPVDVFLIMRLIRKYKRCEITVVGKTNLSIPPVPNKLTAIVLQALYARLPQVIPVYTKQGIPISTVRAARKTLEKGVPLLVFPEGHVQDTFQATNRFYHGAAYLALHTGVPILPTVILNANSLKDVRTKLHVIFGKPIYPSNVAMELDLTMQRGAQARPIIRGITGRVKEEMNEIYSRYSTVQEP